MLLQIQVCLSEQDTSTWHSWFSDEFLLKLSSFTFSPVLGRVRKYSVLIEKLLSLFWFPFVLRENYYLLLQVKRFQKGFQWDASGAKPHRFQLLSHVLQASGQSAPKSGGNKCTLLILTESWQ